MPPVNQPPPGEDSPATPETATSWREYGAALRALREGRGLTITAVEAKHPDTLRRSTISAYELGTGRPSLSWTRLYVTACLGHRNPTLTPERLTAELSRWETAWTRLNRDTTIPTNPPPAPAVPEPRPTNPDTPPAPTGHNQPPPATPDTAAAPKPHRVRIPHSRPGLVGGGVVLLVVAAITATITGLVTRNTDPAQFAGTTTPAPAPAPAPTTAPLTGVAVPASPSAAPAPPPVVTAPAIHASGQVENLRGVEGIDLDTNRRADQNDLGVDISPAATATHLNAMANKVVFTVLPEPGPETDLPPVFRTFEM